MKIHHVRDPIGNQWPHRTYVTAETDNQDRNTGRFVVAIYEIDPLRTSQLDRPTGGWRELAEIQSVRASRILRANEILHRWLRSRIDELNRDDLTVRHHNDAWRIGP